MDSKYKIWMIVFVVLFVLALAGGGYMGYKYYNTNKTLQYILNPQDYVSENDKTALENYNQQILETSIHGAIKSINDNKITVSSDGQDKSYNITSNTIIEKLTEDNQTKGMYVFKTTDKTDLTEGKQVWLIFDKNKPDDATSIKLEDIKYSVH